MTNVESSQAPAVARGNVQLPDVIFAGVYKSGTTFLRGYFTQHPEITWTRKAWFFQEHTYAWPTADYPPPPTIDAPCFIDMFEGLATGHIFERATDWSSVYLIPDVSLAEAGVRQDSVEIAQRVKQTIPNGKILLVLRNQIDWLRSVYLHHIEGLPRDRNSFHDFLLTPQGKLVAGASQFDATIAAYHAAFGRDRVCTLMLEELSANQAPTLRQLCEFLGVSYTPYSASEANRNVGRGIGVSRAVRTARRWRLDKLAKTIPGPVKVFGRDCAGRMLRQDVLSAREKAMIYSFVAASNAQTARLTGVDLARFGYPL